MIETTVSIVDGVEFITKIRRVPPYEYRLGIPIERVSRKLLYQHIDQILNTLGLKLVDYELETNSDIYTTRKLYLVFRLLLVGVNLYWNTIRLSYEYGRVFHAISPGDRFSWKYFMPYYLPALVISKLSKK